MAKNNDSMTEWNRFLLKLTETQQYLKESVILSSLPYEKLEAWDNFMRGKTCPLLENGEHGVYAWDLKQFLTKLK